MKKGFLATGIALAVSIAAFPITYVASAEVKVEECDKIFATVIDSLVDESEVENGRVSATRKPLYDISIEPLGYVYEFSLKENDGYAIIINTQGNYTAQEVIPEATSPYAECEGKCVYVGNMTYLEYSDGVYTAAENGAVIPDEVIEYLAEDALYGGTDPVTGITTVHIDYVSKTTNKNYRMEVAVPYNSSSPYVSSCACVAGSNIVSYFDRYYPELIPDDEPGYEYMGYYFYYSSTKKSLEVVRQLYIDMGTTESNGTTVAQFLSGMNKYGKRAGYNFRYSSCMSGGKFSYSAAQDSMLCGEPVALFLEGYNVAEIGAYNNYDSIAYELSAANHVMVGFGYQEISYTYESGKQETFQYIYVASGYGNRPIGYFNINYNTKIINAYGVCFY